MIKLDNEMICMFDVDETLVMHGYSALGNTLLVKNPYSGTKLLLRPHEKHIELLKQMHGRGRLIGVWSGAGVQWVEAVVKALGLENHVHIAMTKPIAYVDDMKANRWMSNHIYLEES